VLGVRLPIPHVRQTHLLARPPLAAPDRYVMRVPYWRTDVRIPTTWPELARIIGYDELPTNSRRLSPPTPTLPANRGSNLRFAAAGMQEVSPTPSLMWRAWPRSSHRRRSRLTLRCASRTQ
jgi:hypothetical protein